MVYRFFFIFLLIVILVSVYQFSLPSREASKQAFNNSEYIGFESGIRNLQDGTVEVSSFVRMPEVTPNMFLWWFTDYLQTTQHYKMWHPEDHVWMQWENKKVGEIIGSHHLVHEYIGGDMMKLRIQFISPGEILGYDPNDKNIVVLCAKVGLLGMNLNIAEMCHVVQKKVWGSELRSIFWLGVFSDQSPETYLDRFIFSWLANNFVVRKFTVSKSEGLALQKHCSEEMTYLAEFLPTLYQQN